jgi:hypothetical protein
MRIAEIDTVNERASQVFYDIVLENHMSFGGWLLLASGNTAQAYKPLSCV